MKVLIESMTSKRFNIFQIRCWREEPDYAPASAIKTRQEIEAILNGLPPASSFAAIAGELLKLDKMNAVEVTYNGQGCVFYKDWP